MNDAEEHFYIFKVYYSYGMSIVSDFCIIYTVQDLINHTFIRKKKMSLLQLLLLTISRQMSFHNMFEQDTRKSPKTKHIKLW